MSTGPSIRWPSAKSEYVWLLFKDVAQMIKTSGLLSSVNNHGLLAIETISLVWSLWPLWRRKNLKTWPLWPLNGGHLTTLRPWWWPSDHSDRWWWPSDHSNPLMVALWPPWPLMVAHHGIPKGFRVARARSDAGRRQHWRPLPKMLPKAGWSSLS